MTFGACLKAGAMGERAAWDKLIKMQGVRNVVDVRDDKYFQSVDVDFLVEQTNRQYVWVEVKTDEQAYTTGNVFYEVTTSGNIGCFEKTKAAFILIHLPQTDDIYMLNVEKLRRYVEYGVFREVRGGDNSIGYLLKMEDLKKRGIMKRL